MLPCEFSSKILNCKVQELHNQINMRIVIGSLKRPYYMTLSLRKMCPYSEFCWTAFSRIRTRKTPNMDILYAVQNKVSCTKNTHVTKMTHC